MRFQPSYPNQAAPIAVLIDCIRDIIKGIKNIYNKIILQQFKSKEEDKNVEN